MSTTLPTASQLAACTSSGITLATDSSGRVRPFEIAADGIVIATRNEDSVGGDCLRRTSVRHIFQSGSTLTNWNQLGFDDRRLVTTGRNADNDTYQLFANLVLGAQGTAPLSVARRDLVVHLTDQQVLNQVESGSARQPTSQAVAAALAKAKSRIRAVEAAAGADANRRVLAAIARANAARAKTHKVLSPAQKAAIARANSLADANAKRVAEADAGTRLIRSITAAVTQGRQDAVGRIGDVGFFRFTYYELFEEKLRPMEIWDPIQEAATLTASGVATTDSGIVPKQQLFQNDAGGLPSTGRVVEFPSTPTDPGSQYTAATGQRVTVPANGPVNVDTTPDCVFPSAQTIESGVYPLSVRMFAFVSKQALARPAVRSYLAFALSSAGQDLVSAQRLVPLDLRTENIEYELITGNPLPGLASSTTPAPTSSSAAAGGTSAGANTSTTSSVPAAPSSGVSGVDASPSSAPGTTTTTGG
jgi:hypothetical protein